jgi:beta-lactamase superfamily II metal-dependent hydrolase
VKIEKNIPHPDQIEVSLFGPGKGESICVHLGRGKWMIVDSCIDKSTGKPIALTYLTEIGVNYSEDVVLIVISHWHDDHIKGINSIVEVCPNARVALSGALLKEEFITLTRLLYTSQTDQHTAYSSGVCEMAAVIESLVKRKSTKSLLWAPHQCQSDSRIYYSDEIEVWSLSPSNAAILQSQVDFKIEITSQEQRRRYVPVSSNLNAIVLWIITPIGNILLGADLEVQEGKKRDTGWQAVVDSTTKPLGKAKLFKVPHHGSITGHHPDVCKFMLGENVISILTQYATSNLPRDEDIERLLSFSESVFQTTQVSKKIPKRNKVVDSLAKSVAKNRKVITANMGHIQVRSNEEKELYVQLNQFAKKY